VHTFSCFTCSAAGRLSSGRGGRGEGGDADFRALLCALLRDLMAAAHQPAWPAAPFLLLRLTALLQVALRPVSLPVHR
jgi:hypothetical protein